GAAVVVVPGYVVAGTGAFRQLSRASHLVSFATPWRLLVDAADPPRPLIGALSLVVFVQLVLALRRHRGNAESAVALAALLTLAYVLAAAYALPWYDALPWALLAATAASWRDWVLLAHTTVLSLAYLPGRAAAHLAGALHTI